MRVYQYELQPDGPGLSCWLILSCNCLGSTLETAQRGRICDIPVIVPATPIKKITSRVITALTRSRESNGLKEIAGGLPFLPFSRGAIVALVAAAVLIFEIGSAQAEAPGVITTVAGNGTEGYSGDGGAATSAEFHGPISVAVDSAGNLYIGDSGNVRIREVSAATGFITTVAGNGTAGYSGDGGPATSAELDGPTGVLVDAAGNLFIADFGNQRIRKVSAYVPTDKDQCKKGGWMTLSRPDGSPFKNQGDCIQFVNTGK